MSREKVLIEAQRAGARSAPVTDTPEELVRALHLAADLEHKFMCQYLYAAFSLKKHADATCTEAQLEFVRRWGSQNYKVARQEMQHLSVANSLSVAIGGTPNFRHDPIPHRHHWYSGEVLQARFGSDKPKPCDLPFVLDAFSLNTVRRFSCMEAPRLELAVPQDRDVLERWCFEDDGDCGCVAPDGVTIKNLATRVPEIGRGIKIGSVGELYRVIKAGFYHLNETTDGKVFTGATSPQADIPSEYNIYLWPITDLASAISAIDLVTEQGEGEEAPAGFKSHYRDWVAMALEYEQLLEADSNFQPARNVAPNPSLDGSPDEWVRSAMKVDNDAYVLLCYMLTGVYGAYPYWSDGGYPHLSSSLIQNAFAPMMTMLTRSMSEILVTLPLRPGDPDGQLAGPTFHIGADEDKLLKNPANPLFREIDFYAEHADRVVAGLHELHRTAPRWLGADARRRLRFIHQNMSRITKNLVYVNRNDVFPNFQGD